MNVAKGRLIQTFKFLKELNDLRNPVPRVMSGYGTLLWINEWPAHPFIQLRRGDRTEEDDGVGEAILEPLIRIRRATLTPCPKPPDVLDGWLKPTWQSAAQTEAEVLVSRNFPDAAKGSITIAFADDELRATSLRAWASVRAKWVAAERPAVAARKLFEEVHTLWTALQREGDRTELVLGDGLLDIPTQYVPPAGEPADAVRIQHPVVIQRINLTFDPAGPEFFFDPGTEKVELNTALLRLVPSVEGPMIGKFDRELEGSPMEPLGGESTTGFLRRLVQGLFATDGEFVEGERGNTSSGVPTIRRMPVIFLRDRNAGLAITLEHILEDLQNSDAVPPEGLARIVGVELEPSLATAGTGDSRTTQNSQGPEPDILFSKPANAEQYEIAARLAKSKAVLVQGPPGTGKTHTIANLLGCLLAQGKTVLVTAHTTKALRVLRAQVDDALKPLCLSVLESDAESHAQLAHAAQEIAGRLSTSDAGRLRRDAALLREKRTKFLGAEAGLRRQVRDARFSEVEEIVIGGEALGPIEVAKRLKADAQRDGWIPGPLRPSSACPLMDIEVRQLYAFNGVLTPLDEEQLSVRQPALAQIVAAADFRLLVIEKAGADSRAAAHRPEFWAEGATRNLKSGELQALHQQIKTAAIVLFEKSLWLREVLFAGWTGGDLCETWRDLINAIEGLASEAGTAKRLIAAQGTQLPEKCSVDEAAVVLAQIVGHLQSGSSLGLTTRLTHRAWHTFLETCSVDVRMPKALDKIRALQAEANLEVNRRRLAGRWRLLVESQGGPAFSAFGRSPEHGARGYVQEIRRRLEWRANAWEPLIEELRAAGFRWEQWLGSHPHVVGDHGELARAERAGTQGLAEVVEAQAALMRKSELLTALSHQRTYLAGFPQSEGGNVMLRGQDEWNIEIYAEAYSQLARLEGTREAYETRLALLARIQGVATSWALAIVKREGEHGNEKPPGEPVTAWRWRQWRQELDRRASVSIPDLQERLDTTQGELRSLAAEIIEYETWAAQRERTGLESQQALMGYVQTIHKIGKGTGKRVPELLKKARNLLASARRAVPVWVMPLSRVFESFDPRETRFDVVIIDEASQSDVTALAALYFGREHVVVGDKEQVTPDAVGQRLDQVQRLIDTNLQGIPNSHLYDGQTSIYDLAETAFGGVVALKEHFRCVPEIIQFCNELSYNWSILPLREPMSASIRPALIAHRVNGVREGSGKANQVEAEEIASLVVACLHDPAYALNESGQPTTFGVISLLGIEQALLIEEMLRNRLSPATFAKHRLLCGNAAQFQGDERDVIFLSMVDGPPEDGQLPMRDEGPKGLYKKRYNVAVSRARNQLWVVHSLDPNTHLKPRDLRRKLIAHARDPQALLRAMEVQGKRTESIFEKLVLQRLLAARYRVKTQWPVGSYRIDLVVEGSTGRLAVECDGEKWHTAEQLQGDIDRESILRRLGWKFVRIRGSLFFRDPDAALAPVFIKLDQLGIEPLGEGAAPSDPSGVVDRIRSQAETLRAQWRREKEVAAAVEDLATTDREERLPSAPQIPDHRPSEAPKTVPVPTGDDRLGAADHNSGRQANAEAQYPLPEMSDPGVDYKGTSPRDKPSSSETLKPFGPTTRGRGVLDELRALEPRFRDPLCSLCGQAAHLAIAKEGIVIICRKCAKIERVDTHSLQRLVDRLAATCFDCKSDKLKSIARSFGNILECQNPICRRNNSWQNLSERIQR